MTAVYDDPNLLATYREMNFPGVRADEVALQAVRAAAAVLLDAADVTGLFYKDVAALISDVSALKMLDVGCGMGRLGAEVLTLNPDCEYTGVDLSVSMVAEAVAQVSRWRRDDEARLASMANRMSFIVGDATELPFPQRSFDLVVGANLVDRLDNPNTAIKELWRLVEVGGYLLLTDPFHWEGNAPHERFFSFDHVDALLPGAARVDDHPRHSFFCVRRRDGDRVIVYLNENALFRRV
jgi:SAM-dependent methyltransferase